MFSKAQLDYLLDKDDHKLFRTNAARILTSVIEARDSLIKALSIINDVANNADYEAAFDEDDYPFFDDPINMLSEILGSLASKKRELDDLLESEDRINSVKGDKK